MSPSFALCVLQVQQQNTLKVFTHCVSLLENDGSAVYYGEIAENESVGLWLALFLAINLGCVLKCQPRWKNRRQSKQSASHLKVHQEWDALSLRAKALMVVGLCTINKVIS